MNKVLLFSCLFLLFAFSATAQQADPLIPAVNGQVGSIFQSGDTVYIAGSFTTVGGLPRKNLAAFNATTGQVLNWAPNPNNIADVVGISGGNLVVQGSFDTIAGQPRNAMAQFSLATGNITSWQIDSGTASHVGFSSMYNNILYTLEDYLTAIDMASGSVLWSNPYTTYSTNYLAPFDIEVPGDTIYFAAGNQLYAVDRASGQTIYWQDTADQGTITDIAVANGKVFIAGIFSSINGIYREGVAQLDMKGNVTNWNAYSESHCQSLAIQGNDIYVGGFFSSIGNEYVDYNHSLGKLDITTADELCWDILSSVPGALAVDLIYCYDTMVYVCGTQAAETNFFAAFNSPCANLCLPVQGDTRCPGIDGVITVYNSETGVTYQAYSGTTPVGAAVAGTGSVIALTIPAASLDNGSNVFTIQAAKYGCTAFLKNEPTITVVKGSMPSDSIQYDLEIADVGNFICPYYINSLTGPILESPYFALRGNFDSTTSYTIIAGNGSSEAQLPQPAIWYGLGIEAYYSILTPGVNVLRILASNACGNVYLKEMDTVTYLTPSYANSAQIVSQNICQGTEVATVTVYNSIKGLTYTSDYSYSETGNGGSITFNVYTMHAPPGNLAIYAYVPNNTYCPNITLTAGAVTILAAPAPPAITIIGDTILCKPGQTTTAVGPSGYSAYQWFYDLGNEAIAGATNASYEIINNGSLTYTLNAPEEIYLSLSVTDSYGCSSLNYSEMLGYGYNYPYQSIYLSYLGDTNISYKSNSFCPGDSVLLQTSDSYSGFQWLLNDTIIPNAINYYYYAKQNGNYSVASKSDNGYCTAQSPPVQITENPLPAALTTTIETGYIDSSVVLQSPFPTGQLFSWSPAAGLNDSTLASPSFTPLQNGTYAFVVKATDNNGCSNTDTLKVDVTGLTGAVKNTINNTVKVYPNPYSGFTNITYQLNEQASVSAEVYTIIGERLSQFVNEVQQPGAYHYQFSGAASGMYIVKLTINNKEYYQKVVQQ